MLQDKVESRNADYAKIVRHLHFHNVPTDKPQQQSQYDAADAVVLPDSDASAHGNSSPTRRHGYHQQQQQQYGAAAMAAAGSSVGCPADEDWGAGMKDAEFLVWLGDFNYRVDAPEGFVPDRSNPERPVNEQLYHFVLQKVGGWFGMLLLWACCWVCSRSSCPVTCTGYWSMHELTGVALPWLLLCAYCSPTAPGLAERRPVQQGDGLRTIFPGLAEGPICASCTLTVHQMCYVTACVYVWCPLCPCRLLPASIWTC